MQSMLSLLSRFTLKFEIDGLPTISSGQVFFPMNLLYELLWSLLLTSGITLAFSMLVQFSGMKILSFHLSSRRK